MSNLSQGKGNLFSFGAGTLHTYSYTPFLEVFIIVFLLLFFNFLRNYLFLYLIKLQKTMYFLKF